MKQKKCAALILAVILVVTSQILPVFSDSSYVVVKPFGYYGEALLDGYLFNQSDANVTVSIVSKDGDGVYYNQVKADAFGGFDIPFSMMVSGEFQAIVTSERRFSGKVESEWFRYYAYSDYIRVWEIINNGTAAQIEEEMDDILEMFQCGNVDIGIFSIKNGLFTALSNHESFGAYNEENIDTFKETFYDQWLISGFAEENDANVIVNAIDVLKGELNFNALENFNTYLGMQDEDKKTVAQKFISIRKNLNSFEAVKDTLMQSIDEAQVQVVFDAIKNAGNYSVLTSLLRDNAKLLGIEDYMNRYELVRDAVNLELVGKLFTGIADFQSKFEAALTKAEKDADSPSSTPSPKPSGGSSGGNSGSGGGGVAVVSTGSVTGTNAGTATKAVGGDYFIDLNEVEWAKADIELLYRMGIVNGRAERIFEPNADVTREEFLKLVLTALEFQSTGAEVNFEDVARDAWYYSYVADGVQNGVIKGITDTTFGSGQPILRQDLCVMIGRAMTAMGYAVQSGKQLTFTDAAEIADYAVASVTFMNENGIINGTDEGTFLPANYATRAEATCVLYRAMDYVRNHESTIWKPRSSYSDGFNTPSAEQVKSDMVKQLTDKAHPYIHADRAKLDEIKNVLENNSDEFIMRQYSKTKEYADTLVGKTVSPRTVVQQENMLVRRQIVSLMTVYYMEGGQQYLDQALAQFKSLQGITNWMGSAQLNNSATMEAIGVCYDWLYDYLTDAQRKWAIDTIKQNGLYYVTEYFKNPTGYGTKVTGSAGTMVVNMEGSFNHSVYNNSNTMIAALSIAKEDPDYAAFIVANNLKRLEAYLELVGEDSGHEEPVTYYRYLGGRVVLAFSALQSSLGTMYGYENSAGFCTTAYFRLYNTHGLWPFVFGDAYNENLGQSGCNSEAYDLYFFAKYAQDAKLLARILNEDVGPAVMPLLWYDRGELNNITDDIAWDLDAQFTTPNQSTVVFRSTPNDDSNYFGGMYVTKASGVGHSDATSGLFQFDAFGECFASAIGAENYDLPGYWERTQNARRWNYYGKRPEGANCLVINPSLEVGQNVDAAPVIDKYEFGDGSAYAWSDLTEVYKDYVTSYKRGVKLHQNRSRFVVQDEAVMKEASEIFWSINTLAEIDIPDAHTAVLTIDDKRVVVKASANFDFEFYTMAAEKLPTSPATVEGETPHRQYRKLAVRADGVRELKLMVEFIPIVSDREFPEDISPWISIDDWTADEISYAKPTLRGLYDNGTLIEDFAPENYFYSIVYEADEEMRRPNITAESDGDADVQIFYPETLPGYVDVAVTSQGITQYYTISVSQKPKPVDVDSMTKLTVSGVTASDNDGNIPENAIDDDFSTRWSAESSTSVNPYLDLDLGGVKTLQAIGLAFYSGNARKSYYEIFTSVDGEEWSKQIATAESSGTTDDMEYFSLNDVSARYVRYLGLGNSSNMWNSVSEIAVYGK